jgi:hypothetical protein
MTLTDSALQLIDRYLAAFSKRLPLKGRKEITHELRSSLYDELEARYSDAQIDTKEVTELLETWGAPGKLALNYSEHTYLISPEIFPLFRLVFSIVAAVFGITAVASVIYHGITSRTLAALIEIPKFVSGMAAALGFTTATFYLIERFSSKTDWKHELYGDWSPDQLPEIEDPQKVSTPEQIVSICFSALLIIAVPLFGHKIGAYFPYEGQTQFIPALQDGFFAFLPVLAVRWLLSILLASLLLYKKRETMFTGLFSIFLACSDIVIAAVFITFGDQHYFNFEGLKDSPLFEVVPIFKALFYGIMVFIIAASVFDIVKKIRQMMRNTQE